MLIFVLVNYLTLLNQCIVISLRKYDFLGI